MEQLRNALTLAAALVVSSSVAWGASAREVTASTLNVRSGPSTGNAVIGQVHRGEVYAGIRHSGSWWLIQFDHRQGWCHGSYLKSSGRTLRAVTAASLNVRTGASTRYRALGALPRGALVADQGSAGSWRKISFGGRQAWCHGSYLGGAGSTRPTSSRGFVQLAASGAGLYSFSPPSDRWGTPRMIYGLERIGRRWSGQGPRMGVGDISLANGGPMPGHVSHQLGVDVDVRPVRSDGRTGPVTIYQSAYSRTLTQRLLNLFVAELRIRLILFNDRYTRPVQSYPNHHHHFHARIY
ncbi:MAG: penicillin-insensitive murein endopeptidase [Planctomycetota bacterium]